MGTFTSISWTDHTFNPWIGCTKVGPACDGCYAENLFGDSGRFPRVTWGKPGQRATHARTAPSTWAQPRKWDRECAKLGVRRFVFCASVADVFDNDVPTEWRRDLFDLIRATPHLTWLLLTKRPQNIAKLFEAALSEADKFMRFDPPLMSLSECWPRNAAIGCTVVTQAEADRDVPHLLKAKAALNPAFAFLSMEPLLGAVSLTRLRRPPREGYGAGHIDALRGWTRGDGHGYREFDANGTIDWVITGGETDQGAHKARPSHPDWFRSLRDQCAAVGTAYHHKQNGEFSQVAVIGQADPIGDELMVWPDGHVGSGTHTQNGGLGSLQRHVGIGNAGRELDGVIHDARPPVPALQHPGAA